MLKRVGLAEFAAAAGLAAWSGVSRPLRCSAVSYDVPLTTRFRGITRRSGMLIAGPAGWGEWSPFPEYTRPEIDQWWQAAVEAATIGWPVPVRASVPVNSTVPGGQAERAAGVRPRGRVPDGEGQGRRSRPRA